MSQKQGVHGAFSEPGVLGRGVDGPQRGEKLQGACLDFARIQHDKIHEGTDPIELHAETRALGAIVAAAVENLHRHQHRFVRGTLR